MARTGQYQFIFAIEKCSNKMCSLRHPKICKYFSAVGGCKFGTSCHYLHKSRLMILENDIRNLYVEIKELKRRNIEFESLLNKINTEEKQKVISRANRDLKIKTVPAASVLHNSISSEFTTAC